MILTTNELGTTSSIFPTCSQHLKATCWICGPTLTSWRLSTVSLTVSTTTPFTNGVIQPPFSTTSFTPSNRPHSSQDASCFKLAPSITPSISALPLSQRSSLIHGSCLTATSTTNKKTSSLTTANPSAPHGTSRAPRTS